MVSGKNKNVEKCPDISRMLSVFAGIAIQLLTLIFIQEDKVRLFGKKELEKRISKLRNLMKSQDLDGALLTSNSDLFYLTGSIQKGALLITQDEAIYFVRKSLERARNESPLDVSPFDRNIMNEKLSSLSKLGIPMDVMTLSEFNFYKAKLFPKDLEIADLSSTLALTKSVKTEEEIAVIEKAGDINRKIMERVPYLYREGMSDIEMQAAIEACAVGELGHQGMFWLRGSNMDAGMSLVVTGKESLDPTYTDFPIGGKGKNPSVAQGACGAVIEKSFVVDFIGSVNGYNADSTRTFFIGKQDPEVIKTYEELRSLLSEVVEFVTPSITGEEVYNHTMSLVEKMPWKNNFMGFEQKVFFIGHGIGTEVNQLPVMAPKQKQKFENGMVIAIEPKIFLPDFGVIGLENTYKMEDGKLVSITGEIGSADQYVI